MNWKKFEMGQNIFGTVLKIWQQNTCGTAAFLETLHPAINFQKFLCSLGNWLTLLETFCRLIQRAAFFCVMQYIDFQEQSMGGALKVLGKFLKTVLDKVHFICYCPTPSSPGKLSFPAGKSFVLSQIKQLPKLPAPPETQAKTYCLTFPPF